MVSLKRRVSIAHYFESKRKKGALISGGLTVILLALSVIALFAPEYEDRPFLHPGGFILRMRSSLWRSYVTSDCMISEIHIPGLPRLHSVPDELCPELVQALNDIPLTRAQVYACDAEWYVMRDLGHLCILYTSTVNSSLAAACLLLVGAMVQLVALAFIFLFTKSAPVKSTRGAVFAALFISAAFQICAIIIYTFWTPPVAPMFFTQQFQSNLGFGRGVYVLGASAVFTLAVAIGSTRVLKEKYCEDDETRLALEQAKRDNKHKREHLHYITSIKDYTRPVWDLEAPPRKPRKIDDEYIKLEVKRIAKQAFVTPAEF